MTFKMFKHIKIYEVCPNPRVTLHLLGTRHVKVGPGHYILPWSMFGMNTVFSGHGLGPGLGWSRLTFELSIIKSWVSTQKYGEKKKQIIRFNDGFSMK